jgi:hypothetical protein
VAVRGHGTSASATGPVDPMTLKARGPWPARLVSRRHRLNRFAARGSRGCRSRCFRLCTDDNRLTAHAARAQRELCSWLSEVRVCARERVLGTGWEPARPWNSGRAGGPWPRPGWTSWHRPRRMWQASCASGCRTAASRVRRPAPAARSHHRQAAREPGLSGRPWFFASARGAADSGAALLAAPEGQI